MQDPLNISIGLSDVETDFPLLAEADYPFQISESIIEPNKDKTGHNWKLTLALTTPAQGVDGREVRVNTKVFHLMALQAKPDSNDPDAFKRSIAESVDAIFGTTKASRPQFTQSLVSDAVGKTVLAHIFVDEYQGRKSNKVKRLKKVV
jgi:hypothetical protein